MQKVFATVFKYLKNPKYYTNRSVQKLDLHLGTKLGKPYEIWIKITERCNARCQMCEIWRNPKRPELDTEAWKKILTDLRYWIGRKYIWFTGGEAFLRKDLLELVDHCHNLGLKTGIISNGILIDTQLADKIIQTRVDQLHVSLDSLRPEVHDLLRGVSGATLKVPSILQYLNQQRKRLHPGMKMTVKTIIMGPNIEDVIPLTEWTFREGFDEIKFQPIESNLGGQRHNSWYKSSSLWPKSSQMNTVNQVINQLIRLKQSGYPIYNSPAELLVMQNYFKEPENLYERVKSHTLIRNPKCESAVSWLEILSNGDMRVCSEMSLIGNAFSTNPRDIWKNRKVCWKGECPLLLNEDKNQSPTPDLI